MKRTWMWAAGVMMAAPAGMSLAQAAVMASPESVPAAPEQAMGTWTSDYEHVLGTSLQVTVRGANHAEALRAEAAVLAQFKRDDATLSAWRADSEFSRWARTKFEAVPVSAALMEVLAQFDAWRERTDGALDASAEAAVQLWRASAAEGRTPNEREIAEVKEAMAQPHWALDREHGTATRLSETPLALASFAKSYITQRAADAALRAGASGVMLNVGGDVVVRRAMTQVVAIADPAADAENDRALDHVVVRDRAVATSGSYRRGFDLTAEAGVRAPEFSHILDPRTAEPVSHVASSTVIAKDASTAGALATAFSVMPVVESAALAAEMPGVEYLLVTRDGEKIASAGWAGYQLPGLRSVAFAVPPKKSAPAANVWNEQYELGIALELPRTEDVRYRRPYVAVWVEDADHFPVRTIALWHQNPRWLPELKQWYRDDQVRNLAEGTDVSKTVSSATRPAGKYTLKWDGKDNEGKLVKPGTYTICVEASREHGGYQVERQAMEFAGKPQTTTLVPGKELGAVTLEYRKR